ALFCVKSFDTRTAAEALSPALGPDTGVVSLQNGVDNEEILDEVLGLGRALGGAAFVFATIESPGLIAHTLLGRIVFGELDGRVSARATRLRDALAAAGVPVEISADIRRVLWEKYLLISAQAGTTALTRSPIGVIRETPETWRMYRRIVEELAALAGAAGVTLGALCLAAATGFSLAIPWTVKHAIDALAREGAGAALGGDVGLILALAAAHWITRLGSRFATIGAAQRVEADLRDGLYAAL